MKLYAQLRKDLRDKVIGAPIEGNRFIFDGSLRRSKWVGDVFLVWYNGDYQRANSIDFDHITK